MYTVKKGLNNDIWESERDLLKSVPEGNGNRDFLLIPLSRAVLLCTEQRVVMYICVAFCFVWLLLTDVNALLTFGLDATDRSVVWQPCRGTGGPLTVYVQCTLHTLLSVAEERYIQAGGALAVFSGAKQCWHCLPVGGLTSTTGMSVTESLQGGSPELLHRRVWIKVHLCTHAFHDTGYKWMNASHNTPSGDHTGRRYVVNCTVNSHVQQHFTNSVMSRLLDGEPRRFASPLTACVRNIRNTSDCLCGEHYPWLL